ncbi:Adaptive-response sensory-kinase SasA [bioreactor metagenome]|uniref:histidine kinase n=1 Tax=bioreactor metagenome TaxID=1076179 RepID=A0A645A8G8_9ZZZZ
MQIDSTSLTSLLNAFPLPTLMLRDGLVICSNTSALRLLPEVTAGSPCPPAFLYLLGSEGGDRISVSSLGGQDYIVSASETALGIMLVLRPSGGNVPYDGYANLLSEQVRRQLSTLLATTQSMTRVSRDTSSEQGEKLQTLMEVTEALTHASQNNNPTEQSGKLMALLGATEAFTQVSQDNTSEQDRKLFALLSQSTHRLLRVLGSDDLTRRLSVSENPCKTTPMDLTFFCRELCDQVETLSKEAGLSFHPEINCPPLFLIGDPELLRQMLLSLISNAMKASPPNGRFGLRLLNQKSKAIFTVWDEGSGMSSEALSTLFQVGVLPPHPLRGLGVGLSNAQRIAALHGGVLMVESREGSGVRVTVSLPLSPISSLPLRTPKTSLSPASDYSPIWVELSDTLPWQAFLSQIMDE